MLISCIMPTRGRQFYALLALNCFYEQDYMDRELIVLDDADDLSFPEGIHDSHVRYIVAHKRMNIPAKRNELCKMAAGYVIAHWDSDDWYHPGRLSHQVKLLQESGKSVVGYRSALFHGPTMDRVSRYVRQSDYAVGSSLMFTRDWWKKCPFRVDRFNREDKLMVESAFDAGELHSVDGEQFMVARIHAGNTANKDPFNLPYRRVALSDLPEGYPIGV